VDRSGITMQSGPARTTSDSTGLEAASKRLQVILRLSRWASALTVSPETSFKIQNSQQSSNETSAKDSTETPRDGSTISLRRIFTGLKTSPPKSSRLDCVLMGYLG